MNTTDTTNQQQNTYHCSDAFALEGDKERPIKVGCNHYITKPPTRRVTCINTRVLRNNKKSAKKKHLAKLKLKCNKDRSIKPSSY
jgi:hypothetical protein